MAKKTGTSSYNRQLQRIMHQYCDETGIKELDWDAVILWAESKGMITPRMVDPRKKLKQDMARAAREDYIYDDNGEPVRRMHAYVVSNGDRQLTLWGHIEDLTPQKWRASMGIRRRGYRSGILQCDRDNQHYNKHHNPGDSIDLDWNFNPDVQENRMPTEYPDAPPEEDG